MLAGEAEAWSEENHPKDIRTVKGRMKVLVAEFGEQTAASIEPHQIDQWLTENTQWSPATKNRYRSLLSLVYRRGMFKKHVTQQPCSYGSPRGQRAAAAFVTCWMTKRRHSGRLWRSDTLSTFLLWTWLSIQE